jgi:hypothetical protein
MPYATSDGSRIYWEESGTGEPLLLIMGLGYSHEMWHRTRPVSAHCGDSQSTAREGSCGGQTQGITREGRGIPKENVGADEGGMGGAAEEGGCEGKVNSYPIKMRRWDVRRYSGNGEIFIPASLTWF